MPNLQDDKHFDDKAYHKMDKLRYKGQSLSKHFQKIDLIKSSAIFSYL